MNTPTQQPSKSAQKVTGQPSIQSPKTSKKNRSFALLLGVLSLIAFAMQLITGTYYLIATVLAVWPLYVGVRLKVTPLIILGAVGVVLNFGLYLLAIFL